MIVFLVYIVLGAFAGTMAGLLGVGGGLIIVPALVGVFSYLGFHDAVLTHMAVGTSLATIVPTSISSVRAHHLQGAVDWLLFARLTVGIIIGALFGAAVADSLQGSFLQLLFGFFAVLVSIQVGLGLSPDAKRHLPESKGLFLAGGVIGFVSSLFGIGGGSLTIPFLTWCGVKMARTVATSAACGLPIAIAGAIGFMITGWDESLPPWSTGYIYWPAFVGIILSSVIFAQIGAKIAHRLPGEQLRKIFALFLFAVGLKFLASASGIV